MNSVLNLYSKLKKVAEHLRKEVGQKAKDTRSSFKSYMDRADLQHDTSDFYTNVASKSQISSHSDTSFESMSHDQISIEQPSFKETTNKSQMIFQSQTDLEEQQVSVLSVPQKILESKMIYTASTIPESHVVLDDVSDLVPENTPIAQKVKSVFSSVKSLTRGKSPMSSFANNHGEEDVSDATDTSEQSKRVQKIRGANEVRSARAVATYAEQVKVERTANTATSRIYADYASLTPIDPRVKKVMIDAMDEYTANPSSLYFEGVKAKQALERARTSVASFFGVQPAEVVFTSGGTESNNLAFKGVIEFCEQQIGYQQISSLPISARPHIIISTVEHPSIVEMALNFMQKGYNVSFIPVNKNGIVDPKDIRKALTSETVLVSIMYANNEIGTIQPMKDITREVRHFKKSLGRDNSDYPYVHTDACQAVLYEDMRIPGLNIDLLSIDGGKIYGPRSSGVLIKRHYVNMINIGHGGGQENGLRPGTENLYSILGINHALDIAHNEKEDESSRLQALSETLRESIISRLIEKCPHISVNGDIDARIPNNINICFPGLDAEFMVIRLGALGILLSSVTSCRASNDDSSSYVIQALGKSECAQSSLRISLGRFTSALDVVHIIERVVQVVEEQCLAKDITKKGNRH